MTAEHPSPSHLFPITAFTTTTTTEVYTDPNNKLTDSVFKDLESKKRKRLLLEEEGGGGQEQSPPLEKSPRRDDYQVQVQEEEQQGVLIQVSKLNHTEKLLAYKRIWDNLDLSKPADAKLEPFVWQKIREYQRNK